MFGGGGMFELLCPWASAVKNDARSIIIFTKLQCIDD